MKNVVRLGGIGVSAGLLWLFFATRPTLDRSFDAFEWFFLVTSVLLGAGAFLMAKVYDKS